MEQDAAREGPWTGREAFGPENHARLIRIKHRYDPHNVLDAPQGWLTGPRAGGPATR